LAVAPQVARPGHDDVARELPGDPLVVVSDFERPEAKLADVVRLLGIFPPALLALEPQDERHAHLRQYIDAGARLRETGTEPVGACRTALRFLSRFVSCTVNELASKPGLDVDTLGRQ